MSTSKKTTHRVTVTLPQGAVSLLDQLVDRKLFGESRSEVASYFIINALDKLVESKRINE